MRGAALELPGLLGLPSGLYGCLLGGQDDGGPALLRRIAGLDRARTAPVLIDGIDVRALPAHRRGVAWLARDRPAPRARSAASWLGGPPARAAALLGAMGVDPAATPASLSQTGWLGLRLAAALARQPRLLLLEDVLAPLRDALPALPMLRDIAVRDHVTVLHATARREDAFALADHLVLLEAGAMLQAGASATLYERPHSLAIACRLGPANILPATLLDMDDDVATLRLACGPLVQADAPRGPPDPGSALAPGAACALLLRPERIVVSPLPPDELGEGAIAAVLRAVAPMGDSLRLECMLDADTVLLVQRPAALGARALLPGRTVSVAWQARHALVFPA